MVLNDSENATFTLAADFINKSNHPVFLTGKAGTGKTTFLKYIKENTFKNCAIVAPTGVAAMNAGGTTIHSFFQLPFTPFIPAKKDFYRKDSNDTHDLISQLRLNTERKEIIQELDLLIIDEISMVRADVLDAIDTVLRHVRNKHSKPFGGLQVLYIGDMYQLPPVSKQDEWTILSSSYIAPFFFCSRVIAEQPPVYIELNKVYRQRDQDFIDLLNKVRNNEMDEKAYNLLHGRYTSEEIHSEQGDGTITLTTHNAKADAINAKALASINEKPWNFQAVIEGSFYESTFPAEENLILKEGAQVMFIKNDMEKIRRYYNGKIGTVHKIEQEKIWVEVINDGIKQQIELKKEIWRNIKYTLNKSRGRVEEEELGTFTQFPLRLAWAITIHKSQGLTFEKAVIDAGQAFAPGQVYVALSRCTSLNGLRLLSKISYQSLQSDERIVSFANTQKTIEEQSTLLEISTKDFEYELLKSVFTLTEIDNVFESFRHWSVEVFKMAPVIKWMQGLDIHFKSLSATSLKFLNQLQHILSSSEIDDTYLQERISAASVYFDKEIRNVLDVIKTAPFVTDNRQLAKEHDDKLQSIFDALNKKLHFINGCIDGFTLMKYQQQRTSFVRTKLDRNAFSGKSSFIPGDLRHPGLYIQLKERRDELCSTFNLPVYMVCTAASLEEMTNSLPTTLHALGNITGFGKVRLKQFGKSFIEIISEYCAEHSIESNGDNLPKKKERKIKSTISKPDTKNVTYTLYKAGRTINDIASERKLTVSTIEGHLAHYVSEGKLPVSSFLTEAKIKKIFKVRSEFTDDITLTNLKEALPDVSYGELRFFLANEKFSTMQQS